MKFSCSNRIANFTCDTTDSWEWWTDRFGGPLIFIWPKIKKCKGKKLLHFLEKQQVCLNVLDHLNCKPTFLKCIRGKFGIYYYIPFYNALILAKFKTKNIKKIIHQPTYSPDFTPFNFFLNSYSVKFPLTID